MNKTGKNRFFTDIIHRIMPAAFAIVLALSPVAAYVATASESGSTEPEKTSEELPAVYITTEDGKKIDSKEEYLTAEMRMTLPERFAEYENDYTTEEGSTIKIRCRGNTSFYTRLLGKGRKYSYRIKLDSKADLLGMGKSKHWVLIANFFDVTNMRNKLTYDLSGRMGLTYTRSRWVTVYINGEYRGIYTLCENVRIASGRVNIPDWEDRAESVAKTIARIENLDDEDKDSLIDRMTDDLSWITTGEFDGYLISDYCDISDYNIDSGYLIELNSRMDGDTTKFRTDKKVPLEIKSPKALSTNTEMYDYVKGLIADFEEAVYSDDFRTSDGRHYSELCDMQSLIDYYLVFNLFKNCEFGWLSVYLYIDNGKIYFGPCWDFDGGCGNQVTLYSGWFRYDSWFNIDGRAGWWKELCGDPYFVAELSDRWFEIRPLIDEMLDAMPLYHDYIKAESDNDSKKYGMPKNWYMTNKRATDFESEYQTLFEWLNNRIAWLDKQFSKRDPNIEKCGIKQTDALTIDVLSDGSESVPTNNASIGEYPTDYIIKANESGDLRLSVGLSSNSDKSVSVYVNGKFALHTVLNKDVKNELTIPAEYLDRRENGLNVVFLSLSDSSGKSDGSAYISLRARTAGAAEDGECVVKLSGNDTVICEKGSSITLPKISLCENGYSCIGWTDGESTYAFGDAYSVNENGFLYPKWVRNELFPDHGSKSAALPTPPVTTATATAGTTDVPTTEVPATELPKPVSSADTSITDVPATTENGGGKYFWNIWDIDILDVVRIIAGTCAVFTAVLLAVLIVKYKKQR